MPHAGYLLKPVSPYAPPPAHPLKSTISYDYLSTADEVCIKRWLSNRLRDSGSALPHMPGGFPFHYSVDGRGAGSLSYEPYEFCEEISSNVLAMGGPPRRYWATFSFTNATERARSADHGPRPHSSSQKSKRYMSWRAYIAVRDMSYSHTELRTSTFLESVKSSLNQMHLVNLPLLHVELDPAVLNTPYGHLLKNDPRVVLRAMGVSLDKGLPVTIKLANSSHLRHILFVGTDATGKRHLLHTSEM
ncbi:hypothetical protein DFH07DRAFT_988915 [Mycena maculata]|uniref:Uncharacterized protein n=1 Tax=Mycena maculata TaxID=230809 RepID=A0AAD7MX36_9AGAR|nr:hypothetical protein DFH07DRAFT_988915 [Mycena maculata]